MAKDGENINNGNPPSIEDNFFSSGGYGIHPPRRMETLGLARPVDDASFSYEADGYQPSMEDDWIGSDIPVSVTSTPTERIGLGDDNFKWPAGQAESFTFKEQHEVNEPSALPNDNFISSGGYGNHPSMDNTGSLMTGLLAFAYQPIDHLLMEDGTICSDTFVDVTPRLTDYNAEDASLGTLADERATYEEQNQTSPLANDNENMLTATWIKQEAKPKRKRQPEAIGNRSKRGHCNIDIGESSTSQQSELEAERKRREEESLRKAVVHGTKVIKDRISRRAKKDKMDDMSSYIWLRGYENPNKDNQSYPSLDKALAQMQKRWPMRSDLQELLQETNEIEKVSKFMIKGMGGRLANVFKNLAALDAKRKEGVIMVDQKEVHSKFPWLCWKEIATNDQVKVSDFQHLEKAIGKTTGRSIPKHLEDIANKVKKARGKDTEYANEDIEVLVCAAINEMENLTLDALNWSILQKWRDTLNSATKRGFCVEFAEILLREKLNAYLAYLKTQGE